MPAINKWINQKSALMMHRMPTSGRSSLLNYNINRKGGGFWCVLDGTFNKTLERDDTKLNS